jgi:LacI family transcriptional regulator
MKAFEKWELMKKITIADIANLAHTSKSTVSRVLNDTGYVKAETRDEILKVIHETNYSPSNAARMLASSKSRMIAVVVPEITNEFFMETLRGFSEYADEKDYILIYFDTQNDRKKEENVLVELGGLGVSGLILTVTADYSEEKDAQQNWKCRTLIRRLNIPVVELDRHVKDAEWDGVFFENYRAAYDATKALIDAGNRRIATITGDMELLIARDRLRGYKEALRDAGLSVDERLIYRSDFSVEEAYRAGKKMLSAEEIPDAVFTSNNSTTLGFIRSVREKKLKLGKDIGLLGIDHIETLDDIGYNFSYVSRTPSEMGYKAMEMLDNRINGKNGLRNIIYTSYKLVLNGSERNDKYVGVWRDSDSR